MLTPCLLLFTVTFTTVSRNLGFCDKQRKLEIDIVCARSWFSQMSLRCAVSISSPAEVPSIAVESREKNQPSLCLWGRCGKKTVFSSVHQARNLLRFLSPLCGLWKYLRQAFVGAAEHICVHNEVIEVTVSIWSLKLIEHITLMPGSQRWEFNACWSHSDRKISSWVDYFLKFRWHYIFDQTLWSDLHEILCCQLRRDKCGKLARNGK